jgi:DNA-binding protein HU-beta
VSNENWEGQLIGFPLKHLTIYLLNLTNQLLVKREKSNSKGGNMPTSKKPITKNQIVTHFAEKFELSKKTASSIIDEMAMLATNETKKAGAFTFPGIGKLVLVKRKARVGRNPATGEQIKIPAKTVVKMRVAKACKDAIVPPKK